MNESSGNPNSASVRPYSFTSLVVQDVRSKTENHVLRMELKNLNQCLTDLIEQIKDYSNCLRWFIV